MAKVEIKYVVFTAVAASGEFAPEVLNASEYSKLKRREYKCEYKNQNPEKFENENRYKDLFFIELYENKLKELL